MYEPTDEQIEALAKHEFETSSRNEWPTAHDLEQRDFKDWARETAASSAFQAIIRAARAQAWDDGYDHGFYDREALSPDITGRDASEGRSINPYEEAADV